MGWRGSAGPGGENWGKPQSRNPSFAGGGEDGDGGDDDQSEAMETRLNDESQRRDQRERPNLDG
ncbi:hypothetical protein JMJ76_0005688 [Colletotrichum scovillei]|nr:hypothetical protein JMJ76_0005688 [Colletotrichum scovillei]